MLIRNACIEGYADLVDLRLMHGAVQEIGAGLVKGLYESELDLAGDMLRLCTEDTPIPARLQRRAVRRPADTHIMPGTPGPLVRWRGELLIAVLDEHAAD